MLTKEQKEMLRGLAVARQENISSGEASQVDPAQLKELLGGERQYPNLDPSIEAGADGALADIAKLKGGDREFPNLDPNIEEGFNASQMDVAKLRGLDELKKKWR